MKRILVGTISSAMAFLFSWSANAQYIAEFKATDARLSSPFTVTNGYISQIGHTGVTNGGRAVFSFTAPSNGEYAILAVVEASSQDARSIFVGIDSEPNEPGSKWEIPVKPGFATNLVTSAAGTPRYFNLSKGSHQLIIRGEGPNVKLSRISIALRPSPPSNLHISTGNP